MKNISPNRILVFFVIAVMLLAIGYGVYVIGSPSYQRSVAFDQQRIFDLQNISSGVQSYWLRRGQLPASLGDLQNQDLYIPSLADPRTQQPYEYRALGARTYEVCGVFETDSSGYTIAPKPGFDPNGNWSHGIGRDCFTREVFSQQPVL